MSALASCGVDLPNIPGRACDDTHPCRAPRACIGGVCVDPGAGGGDGEGGGAGTGGGGGGGGGSMGGGSGAGGGGSSGGGPGGGKGGGAGGGAAIAPLWKQSAHGFSGQSELGTARVEIDSLRGNKVVSTVITSNDLNDRATANQQDAGSLPRTGNGRIRGKFQLPVPLKLAANSTFVWLATAGGKPLIQLSFNSIGQLVANSAAGMIAPASVSNNITWSNDGGGFQPNVDYLVEIAWQRGSYRRIWINGAQVAQVTNLVGDAGMLELPDRLQLGIYRYDGTVDAGWSVTLSDWQLTDNPSVVLSD